MTISSILDTPVSWLSCYADQYPQNTILSKYLNDTSYKDQVLKIRATEDPNKRKELKAQLPAIMPSGIFNGRGEKNLINHSCLMQVDIDQKDNPHIANFHSVREVLIKIPFVAYCSLSVSGNGYWLIIPISDPLKHKQHFAAIREYFKGININIDPAPSNVASLRGYSYDENPYFNHHPLTFTDTIEAPTLRKVAFNPKNGHGLATSPFDDFNQNGEIEDMLIACGWSLDSVVGTNRRYTRPGKSRGISATYCIERKVFFVFTSNSIFEANKPYDHVGVYCRLECKGDFKLCRQKLMTMGYGKTVIV